MLATTDERQDARPTVDPPLHRGFQPWNKTPDTRRPGHNQTPPEAASTHTQLLSTATTSSPTNPSMFFGHVGGTSANQNSGLTIDSFANPALSGMASMYSRIAGLHHTPSYDSWLSLSGSSNPLDFDMSSFPNPWLKDSTATANFPNQLGGGGYSGSSGYPGFSPALFHSSPRDVYKGLLQGQPDLASVASPFLPPPSTPASNPRSSRRYPGRSNCDCPNCQEADRLGE